MSPWLVDVTICAVSSAAAEDTNYGKENFACSSSDTQEYWIYIKTNEPIENSRIYLMLCVLCHKLLIVGDNSNNGRKTKRKLCLLSLDKDSQKWGSFSVCREEWSVWRHEPWNSINIYRHCESMISGRDNLRCFVRRGGRYELWKRKFCLFE